MQWESTFSWRSRNWWSKISRTLIFKFVEASVPGCICQPGNGSSGQKFWRRFWFYSLTWLHSDIDITVIQDGSEREILAVLRDAVNCSNMAQIGSVRLIDTAKVILQETWSTESSSIGASFNICRSQCWNLLKMQQNLPLTLLYANWMESAGPARLFNGVKNILFSRSYSL